VTFDAVHYYPQPQAAGASGWSGKMAGRPSDLDKVGRGRFTGGNYSRPGPSFDFSFDSRRELKSHFIDYKRVS
jgi:hypothetical protein